MKKISFLLSGLFFLNGLLPAQHRHEPGALPAEGMTALNPEPQPLLSQAGRLVNALSYLGSPLSSSDALRLDKLKNSKPDSSSTRIIQEILDPYCLAVVHINPEARVMVTRGAADALLMQQGWTIFLIKVYNESGTNARLEVQSPNAAPVLYGSYGGQHAAPERLLTAGQVADRFLEMQLYRDRPMEPSLSGVKLEYAILQVYSRDKGEREAEIGFNIGQGTQDIAYRNATSILFHIKSSVSVKLHVADENGLPVTGSFVITDGIGHIYPLPSRRMALSDEYPDFYFEPQIYRADGEQVLLPPGNFQFRFTRGPEYLLQTRQITIPSGRDSAIESFQLKRWINMASLGWYSADHHLHAAGCSHYESPEEGVDPPAMFRQALGEDLDMATILSWGPGWYHQKQFFTGAVHPLSTRQNILRYDVEVSGFPSSHAGHLVLLNLREQDYPGTARIEQWPSWTLPILKWAKEQGGLTGYAHSGWGLEPVTTTNELPNFIMPKMDGIGANEYVVSVTQNAVDVFSAGDTPAPWELNMWYHTLNCGFRPRLSGETDFPCIYDGRVGIARSYFKPDSALSYPAYIDAIKKGRSYISDGRSHIIDFSVEGVEMGTRNSELALQKPGIVHVSAKVAAYLSAEQDAEGAAIAQKPLDEKPYWNTERARIKKTRSVRVELIANGIPVDTMEVVADGNWSLVKFKYEVKRSSWLALRIFPSAHSNPVFVLVDRKPILIRESALWCRKAVDQCWKTKQPNIRAEERPAAEAAYNKAREVYDEMIR